MRLRFWTMPTAALTLLTLGCSPTLDREADAGSYEDGIRRGVVRGYTEPGFGGELRSFAVGDHDLRGGRWDDVIRSVRVFGDYTVELYVDGAFVGASEVLSRDTPALSSLDGRVSSLRVRPTSAAMPPDAGAVTPPPEPDAGTVAPPADAGTDAGAVTPPADAGTDATPPDITPEPSTSGLVGWATVAGLGLSGTTGGAGGPMATATTVAEFNMLAAGDTPRVIQVSGRLTGNLAVGSNKTILGLRDSEVHGHIELDQSVNVIVQNLRVVGNNCADNADCERGADAITVTRNAHHLWLDHCDISDGSDGNLDIIHAADFVTVSWTRFSYSGRRPGGHQFSSLIGNTDNNPEDEGHLKVTFHHCWWADNVGERMPRVRYGQVHLFNNLFSAAGNNYCVRAGTRATILSESNAFVGVASPFDLAGGDVLTRGDVFRMTSGNTRGTGRGFVPPYVYAAEPTDGLEAAIRGGIGPR